VLASLAAVTLWLDLAGAGEADLAWPPVTKECRPWSYWWWPGSAVDATNLTRELQRYAGAGWGGLHVIPIYGAKGWEDRYLDYLSPSWMAMLGHAIREAQRLGVGVDMTTGSGWCFGGPRVTDLEANAVVVTRTFEVGPGGRLGEKFDRQATQALMAFAPEGNMVDLLPEVREDGSVDWSAEGGLWRVIAVSQKPSGQRVKRAAPGGGGHMLNLFFPAGMKNYLRWFEEAFAPYDGPLPRAMYHDSYEYNSNWSPDLFDQFARRRGYRLETELPALLGSLEDDHAARVKCDYRETLSDILIEETLPLWVRWCHSRGILTRNQAHGSPGNLLDLYALVDIPETEMFHTDRAKLVSKLASSAAHVTGRRLTAAETGTWLAEHFTETLADMKYLQDDLFLSGVNHIIYHGACYSPDDAPWPGWLFYASYQMNPRNSVWRDVPALNAYAARCQSILQAGTPDHDLLLYWPLHDFWQRHGRLDQRLTVHARDWLEGQPVGRTAGRLWHRGYSFDYISDRQLGLAETKSGAITVPGGTYRAVVVPACDHMAVATLESLLRLARSGATVIFERQLPRDVPGWGALKQRRVALEALLASVGPLGPLDAGVGETKLGQGRILVGDLERALAIAGVAREAMVDHPGLMFISRRFDEGRHYFVANRGEQAVDGWVPLAVAARSVVLMDPLTGRAGVGTIRSAGGANTEVLAPLQPGESLILRAFTTRPVDGPAWRAWHPVGAPVEIAGTWQVDFLTGGPQLPAPIRTTKLGSWTSLGGEEAQRFGGTAVYSVVFDAPPGAAAHWYMDLGRVCQSARVRLNGQELGTVFTPPFRVLVADLRPRGNRLEVEVTNVAANRIRDLDRRQVVWKNFHDINFVNTNYQPFDASGWPVADSGLLGPVRLQPLREASEAK
jgi:hypothetical protein